MIFGPTFEEMSNPTKIAPHVRERARNAYFDAPLNSYNLFNINWRDFDNQIYQLVLPPELTGVEANIVLIHGYKFPSGSHKVGAAYSVLMEEILMNDVDPRKHRLVFPSTGNYGIGGAWVGGRMGCDSVVVLPEEMSAERFERIAGYGATTIKTHGSESNVKEIYDETKRLKASDPNIRILNQFEVMGNYRFHYYVTGNTVVDLASDLRDKGIGNGKISAFVSAMGSAGTIAAGDRLKQLWSDCKIVGLEPIQCPTLYNNGYGSHDIQGIGDKHVTWIHNVLNMDALMCVDDLACKQMLQVFAEFTGRDALADEYGIDSQVIHDLSEMLGISGICNVLGAIKTAKYYNMGKDDVIVTVATDGMDRYHSVMNAMQARNGDLDVHSALDRVQSIFHDADTDWILEGTSHNRERWHNLKYYTWVEQQGKTVEELDAQRDPEWWVGHQNLIPELDKRLIEYRKLEGTD